MIMAEANAYFQISCNWISYDVFQGRYGQLSKQIRDDEAHTALFSNIELVDGAIVEMETLLQNESLLISLLEKVDDITILCLGLRFFDVALHFKMSARQDECSLPFVIEHPLSSSLIDCWKYLTSGKLKRHVSADGNVSFYA